MYTHVGGRARHLSESDDEVIDGRQRLPPRRGGCRTRAYAGRAGAAVAESRGKIQRVDVDSHARCRQGEGVGGVCARDACAAGTGIGLYHEMECPGPIYTCIYIFIYI